MHLALLDVIELSLAKDLSDRFYDRTDAAAADDDDDGMVMVMVMIMMMKCVIKLSRRADSDGCSA